jgi:hypothetical protein
MASQSTDGAICTFATGQRALTAVLFVLAAQRVHSKLQKPPHVPAPGSGAAAAVTNEWQERTGSRRDARVQFEPPKAARPPGQRTGGFCQLVRAVSRRYALAVAKVTF